MKIPTFRDGEDAARATARERIRSYEREDGTIDEEALLELADLEHEAAKYADLDY